jgi:hypothetical protein
VQKQGYPWMKPELKAKVLGLNGAKIYGVDPQAVMRHGSIDPIGRIKQARASEPTFATYGPRTAAEYEAFIAMTGGSPI